VAPLWHFRLVADGQRGRYYWGEREILSGQFRVEYEGEGRKVRPATAPANEFWSWLPDYKAFNEYYDRRLYDIGCSVHLIAIGVEVDFSLFELADFLCGLVGLDPAGDQVRSEQSSGQKKHATSQ